MRQGPGRPTGGASDGPADPAALMRDWITIWQSEMSAAATDPELLHNWTRLVEIWAAAARSATLLIPPAGGGARDAAPGSARPEPSAGAETADAAPDARDAAIEHLARRAAELERKLAGLDPPAAG